MDHPLACFPITSTNDVGEAQSILSRELADLRIRKARDHRAFHLEMNGVHLDRTMLGYNHFDTETLIEPDGAKDAVILVMGVGTPAIFHLDGEPVVCAGKGAIVTPSRRITIHRPAGSGIFIIKAGFDAIERRLWEVMDRRPGKPIVFDRSVDVTKGVGAQARRILDSLVNTFEQDNTVVETPLLRAGFDDMLLNTLLALPNNYSDELMGEPRRTVAPALVRKTEEFLEAHASESITIADLVAQFGCSRAALYNAYRRYRDYTPLQFLAEFSLKSAREALQSPSPGNTVSSIAYACGFSHLGRFTAAYCKRFGESPSKTLRKAAHKIDM